MTGYFFMIIDSLVERIYTLAMSKGIDIQSTIIRSGVLFWVISTVILFVIGVFDWYRNPNLTWVFWLVLPAQILIIWQLMKKLRPLSLPYWKNVAFGTMVSLITGVGMLFSSLFFTEVVFPDYFDTIKEVGIEIYEDDGATQDEIDEYVAYYESEGLGIANAVSGAIGSTVTGLVMSLVIALFFRQKKGEE